MPQSTDPVDIMEDTMEDAMGGEDAMDVEYAMDADALDGLGLDGRGLDSQTSNQGKSRPLSSNFNSKLN